MKRREFITLLGGGAAWPLAARVQQPDRLRRIGVLTGGDEADAEYQARFAVFRQALQQLGWTEGYNIRFDFRFGSSGDSDLARRYARELIALAPDVILPSGSPNVRALQQATRTVPIVFVNVPDPVRAGPCHKLRTARWQYHRLPAVRIRHEREIVGAAQRDRSWPDPRGDVATSDKPRRHRNVCCDAGCGPLFAGGN
jgi:hypothetical protein